MIAEGIIGYVIAAIVIGVAMGVAIENTEKPDTVPLGVCVFFCGLLWPLVVLVFAAGSIFWLFGTFIEWLVDRLEAKK